MKSKSKYLMFLIFLVCILIFSIYYIEKINRTRVSANVTDNDMYNETYTETYVGLEAGRAKKAEEDILEAEIPEELQELLERNHETYDFVTNYSNREKYIDKKLTDKDISKGVPLFLQWDKRWGYDLYGDEMIALSGCGPTCMSMVMVYLTGDLEHTPLKIADYSERNGYIDNGATKWVFMSEGAEGLGIVSRELPLDYNKVVNSLNNGNPVILSVGEGDFTTKGHFIVLTGVAEDGSLYVNDPNSRERSSKTWEWDRLSPQIKNLWSYSI